MTNTGDVLGGLTEVQPWQAYLDEHQQRFVDEYLELLRIPSVSTEPAHREDVRRAADWVAARLRQIGIEDVRLMETGGHPCVYGEWLHAAGKPTVLFYGHFDVQPADPLDLWDSPPFDPLVKDGKVFARGASDMKGSLLLPIIACEALFQADGTLPLNVKFLFEGEEEIGSPSLAKFVSEHQDLLTCDVTISADGGVGTMEAPVIGLGNRGLCGLQVNVRTSSTDLHSGMGGVAPNAAHALIQILQTLRDDNMHILVDSFYDEVRPLTDTDKETISTFPFDAERTKEQAGLKEIVGEAGFTPQERTAARPTLEVNGLWSGFQGDGVKTVIPSEAHAKITCRLVPDQAPQVVRQRVIDHILRVAPSYADVNVDVLPGEAFPYVLPTESPAFGSLERVVQAVSDGPLKFSRGGGSVPVMGMLKQTLGVETITLGGSQGGERAHAPNEFYRLANFARIQRAFCLLLNDLAETLPAGD